MTPDEIRAKCRKVHLVITNDRIFSDAITGEEQVSVPAFGRKEDAHRNMVERQQCEDMIRNAPEIYGKSKTPPNRRRTVSFYLVPAIKVDD